MNHYNVILKLARVIFEFPDSTGFNNFVCVVRVIEWHYIVSCTKINKFILYLLLLYCTYH